jgi:hypothetical protein
MLEQLAATAPGANPCTATGQSLECLVHTTQQLTVWLTQRGQSLLATPTATAWFNDWAQHWEAQVQKMAGFPELEQAFAQLRRDFPAFTDYVRVSQQVTTQIAQVLTEPDMAYMVAADAQILANEVTRLLSTTNYTPVLEHFRAQWQALLAAEPTYQALQGEATRVTTALTQLQQAIHDTVASCQQRGYGDRCLDPGFNPALQAVLPQFRSEKDQVLVQVAQVAETSSQFSVRFSQRADVQAFNQGASETLRTTVARVVPALQQAQDAFNTQVLAIPEVHTQVGTLWAQMLALGQKLGLVD